MDYKQFGEMRREARITQFRIASLSSVYQTEVSLYERGGVVSANRVKALHRALERELRDIHSRSEALLDQLQEATTVE